MIKRKITFGTYDTAARGWTLAGWVLDPAEEKTNFVDKPGGDGSWDLSTSLTDGIATFNDRTLTVTLECSEGDRLSREAEIRNMINLLHGTRVNIELPDDELHHLSGKLHIQREYNDLAHAAVTVTAVCDPWKYANTETAVTLTATTTAKTARIINNGRRAVVPVLTITGSSSTSVTIKYGAKTLTCSVGEYKWPDILLTPGAHEITYSGSGTLKIAYREAVLE